jgi:multiple sugar transport system substrate-binding protein
MGFRIRVAPSPKGALVALALIAGTLLALTPALAGAPNGLAWDQFKGTTLRVLLHENQWYGSLVDSIPDFEKLTGIKVVVEPTGQIQLWNALEDALPQRGKVDVFATVPGLDGIRYHRMGWVQPINAFLENPRLTAPEYRWDDFLPGLRKGMTVRGAILGPPVMGEHLALLYRKDLFQQQGRLAPRTLKELEDAAQGMHGFPMAPSNGRGVGLVGRGQGAFATSMYGALLHAMGKSWLDAAGQPTMSSPESLAALEMLHTLLVRYGPPDISSFGWQEATGYFASGKASMYIESGSVYPLLEMADSSQVKGRVGYALFPAGPGGSGTTLAARGLAIAKQSAHPEAAWLFCQWATATPQVEDALAKGVLVPRTSVWRNKSISTKIPPDLAASFQEAGQIGNPAWAPPLVAVTAAREAVGSAISATLRGENIRVAAAAADKRLREIISQTER